MSVQITKEDFEEYKRVQESGMFNMFDPRARDMTSLSKEQWIRIMKDYEKLNKSWSEENES